MIWGLTLEQESKKNICLPDLHIGNSSISSFFLWANPGVHEYPVKMQITPEGKVPNLQVLLQFNSSNASNLVNQASPGEAGMSLPGETHGVGKSQKMEPSLWGLNVTTWETWGEGPQQQQRRLMKGPKVSNPDPSHHPQPALHRTSITWLISKSNNHSPLFFQTPLCSFFTILWSGCFGWCVYTSWRYKECNMSLSLHFSCFIKSSVSSLSPVSFLSSSFLTQ